MKNYNLIAIIVIMLSCCAIIYGLAKKESQEDPVKLKGHDTSSTSPVPAIVEE
ncbi:MAG: hypothetical protein WC707_04000 [Candidatus Babeliaceae bacterium]|jgi:hypothetical protein